MSLSNLAKKESTVGEMVNLMAVNVHSLHEFAHHLNMAWTCVACILVGSYLLWQELGMVASFAGLIVMIVLLPANVVASNQGKKLQLKKLRFTDSRVKMINEMLNGIKVIKLYAWEIPFKQLINKIRGCEIKVLKQIAYFSIIPQFSWVLTPFLV